MRTIEKNMHRTLMIPCTCICNPYKNNVVFTVPSFLFAKRTMSTGEVKELLFRHRDGT
jgi:hypothetical protein